MLITCKCLNVVIDAQNSDIKDVDIGNLNLSAEEETDRFFKETIYCVEHARISKVQSCLVQVRNIGNWIIHNCLNCSSNTHAIQREKGAAFVLFTKAMLTDQSQIAALKSCDGYSPVFRIIVNRGVDQSATRLSKFSASQLPAAAKTAVSALQQQLSDIVQQETIRTEEAVRRFQEQQYAALEEFRERAHSDIRILSSLLADACQDIGTTPASTLEQISQPDSPPLTPESGNPPSTVRPRALGTVPAVGPRLALKQPSARSDVRQANRHSPILPPNSKTDRQLTSRMYGPNSGRSNNLISGNGGSFDSEGLFDLDGMDDTSPGEVLQSEEETDTDESGSHDEGIHIPRGRSGSSQLAKSLPVNVPTYVPIKRRTGEIEGDRHPQDPQDIAASIRALAKSVHGESDVFGDLPRPRFSTQI